MVRGQLGRLGCKLLSRLVESLLRLVVLGLRRQLLLLIEGLRVGLAIGLSSIHVCVEDSSEPGGRSSLRGVHCSRQLWRIERRVSCLRRRGVPPCFAND